MEIICWRCNGNIWNWLSFALMRISILALWETCIRQSGARCIDIIMTWLPLYGGQKSLFTTNTTSAMQPVWRLDRSRKRISKNGSIRLWRCGMTVPMERIPWKSTSSGWKGISHAQTGQIKNPSWLNLSVQTGGIPSCVKLAGWYEKSYQSSIIFDLVSKNMLRRNDFWFRSLFPLVVGHHI